MLFVDLVFYEFLLLQKGVKFLLCVFNVLLNWVKLFLLIFLKILNKFFSIRIQRTELRLLITSIFKQEFVFGILKGNLLLQSIRRIWVHFAYISGSNCVLKKLLIYLLILKHILVDLRLLISQWLLRLSHWLKCGVSLLRHSLLLVLLTYYVLSSKRRKGILLYWLRSVWETVLISSVSER